MEGRENAPRRKMNALLEIKLFACHFSNWAGRQKFRLPGMILNFYNLCYVLFFFFSVALTVYDVCNFVCSCFSFFLLLLKKCFLAIDILANQLSVFPSWESLLRRLL